MLCSYLYNKYIPPTKSQIMLFMLLHYFSFKDQEIIDITGIMESRWWGKYIWKG